MSSSEKKESVSASMIWKTLERYSVLGVQLIVQIVIARILEPKEFGLVSMMTVFIAIANVFIQNGFNTALVQMKKADNKDYSTALIINLLIGVGLYAVIYFASPVVSSYYSQPAINNCLRVLALILIIGAFNSIQLAIASRNMQFRKVFKCNLLAGIISGVVGIVFASLGFGVWALIWQQISNVFTVAVVLGFSLKWKPEMVFKKESAKRMFSFGWKMLLAGLINTLYNELNSLVIGKKYSSEDLAYYNKGKQFPMYITTGIDSSIQSVMFSALSKVQNDLQVVQGMLRKSISINSYIVFPLMVGLALVAEPLTIVLLTEKWLPVVPYMRICCLTFAWHPIATAHLQALAAIGRSDMRLKLEFIKKPLGILFLFIAVNYGPMAIAISTLLTSLIGLISEIIASRIYVKLSIRKQLYDLTQIIATTLFMGVSVYLINYIVLPKIVTLILQVIVGIVTYLVASVIIKPFGYTYLIDFVKNKIFKK